MKTTFSKSKRIISVLLAVLLAFSSAAIVTSAEDHEHNYVATVYQPTCTQKGFTVYACECGDEYTADYVEPLGHDYDDGVYIDAFCETYGGTLYTCRRPGCSDLEIEHSWFKINEEDPPIGHILSDYEIVAHPSVADSFAKKAYCTREGCNYSTFESDEENNVNVYYKVRFFTDYALPEDGYYTETDGTVVADMSKYVRKLIRTDYALAGSSYALSDTPLAGAFRFKTAECGRYQVTGWTNSLDNISANVDTFAVYTEHDMYHTVSFVEPSSGVDNPTSGDTVLHGRGATAPADPVKNSDLINNYVFDGWDTDFSHVYSDIVVRAKFKEIKRVYKLVYHDKDGNVIGSEIFNYGDPALNPPDVVEEYEDDNYSYTFANSWKLASGASYSLRSLIVPSWCHEEYNPGTEGDESISNALKGIMDVYPVYNKGAKTYPLTVNLSSTTGEALSAVSIRIYDSNGMVADNRTVSNATSVDFNLISGVYVVSVAYAGDVQEQSVVLPTQNSLDFALTIAIPDPIDEGPCGHICHVAVVGRIYIMFNNLIYMLTGKKTICCDDMYSGRYAKYIKY